MTWQSIVIGLVMLITGIIIGTVAFRFTSLKLRQQNTLQDKLEKSKAELNEYREELTSYFARSAELLSNMAEDYRQLYQHMVKSSNSLLSQRSEQNPFHYRSTEEEFDNNQILEEIQPRDYLKNNSALLKSNTKFK